jgi:peptide-methionine (S)-S-oxide reductase
VQRQGIREGASPTAEYELVSTGETGHAESVKITYDPSQITYGRLLQIFFSVAHDPTQLNRQGPDEGSQYRSAIFYTGDEQKRIAEAYIAQLSQAKVFSRPIVTQVAPLKAFYPAEAYHQDYATRHPDNPYIVYNDATKVAHLRQQFPELYKN